MSAEEDMILERKVEEVFLDLGNKAIKSKSVLLPFEVKTGCFDEMQEFPSFTFKARGFHEAEALPPGVGEYEGDLEIRLTVPDDVPVTVLELGISQIRRYFSSPDCMRNAINPPSTKRKIKRFYLQDIWFVDSDDEVGDATNTKILFYRILCRDDDGSGEE